MLPPGCFGSPWVILRCPRWSTGGPNVAKLGRSQTPPPTASGQFAVGQRLCRLLADVGYRSIDQVPFALWILPALHLHLLHVGVASA